MTSKDKAEWKKVQAYVSDRLSYWLPGVPQRTKDAARDDEEKKQLEEAEKPSYQPDHHGYDNDHTCAADLAKLKIATSALPAHSLTELTASRSTWAQASWIPKYIVTFETCFFQ